MRNNFMSNYSVFKSSTPNGNAYSARRKDPTTGEVTGGFVRNPNGTYTDTAPKGPTANVFVEMPQYTNLSKSQANFTKNKLKEIDRFNGVKLAYVYE